MIVVVTKKKTSGASRLFFIISKKQIFRAVDRNKIKRRIRVIFKKFLQNPDVVYTVKVQKEALSTSFQDLQKIIIQQI